MAEPQFSDIPSGAQVVSQPPAYSDLPSGAQIVASAPAPQFSDLPRGAQVLPAPTSPAYSDLPANATVVHDPTHDPNARFFSGTGEATISAYQPTIWDRIKSAFEYANPNTRPRIQPKDRDDNSMQIVRPEEFMSETEQKEHPILTGLGQVAGGMTSPESVMLIAGTAGLGELPGAARLLPRLMSAGFGAQSIYQAYKTVPAIRDAWNRGDVSEVERLLTHSVADLGMAALAAKHAATGKGAISGKVNESPAPAVETRVTEPTSPLGEVLQEPAPDVRIVDSAAMKDHLESQDAVEASKPEADRSASVQGPRDVAEMRAPKGETARIVADDHIPVVTRDEVLDRAVQNILNNSDALQKLGIDPATIKTDGDIEGALLRASDHIRSNLDPRAEAVITLEGQKNLADQLNMRVEDLLARRNGQAYNAEELLASRALLNSSYRNVLTLAKNAAENPGDEAAEAAYGNAFSVHKAIQEKIAAVRAESGRALGSFRVEQDDLPQKKIADIFAKLPKAALGESAELVSRLDPSDPASVRRLNQFVEQVTPRTTLEKLQEAYRNGLLSSPHTIIVKTASEAAMVAMETMKKAIAGGIGGLKDSPDRFAAESYYYAKGMAQALAEHTKPILSGEFQLEGSPGFERAPVQAIKGTLGQIVRAPSEAMSRMTNLMYAGNYFGELNSLAAREALGEGLEGDAFHARQEWLAHHPTEEMTEAAHELATTNTFQNRLGGFAGKIEQALNTKPKAAWLPESLKSAPPLRFLFPFFRTPINLLKASITHATPYELLNGIAKGDTDAMARGVLGSSISAALAYLALTGRITGGGPIDFKKEETLRATGWQPYSVKVGDRYYSYRRFEPVGWTASLIADAVHGMKNGDPETVSQSKADTAIRHIMRSLDDFPFMGTLANLIQAVHDPVGQRAQTFINREAGSLVPAIVADVAETLDPTVRRPKTALQAIESRIPGMTGAAQPIVDVTGRTVRRPANAFGGASPFPASKVNNDPVVRELARLGVSTPQPPTTVKWRGRQTTLSDAERTQLAQQEGQELAARLVRMIPSAAWTRLSDDTKRKRVAQIRRVIEEARSQRIARLLKQTQASLSSGSL